MLESRTALDQENFAEALQKAQQLVTLHPNDADAYLCYGDVFLAMNNGPKAAEQYERAIALRPDLAEAYFKLGHACEMREDDLGALSQYQTARRLDPANDLYMAHHGRLLNKKGLDSGNTNYENEGLALMEKAFHAGVRDADLNEQLAIAHVLKATENWQKHPEQEDTIVPTDAAHLQHAKIHLEWVRNLHDPANEAIAKRLAELDSVVHDNEKRVFAGYPYLRKAPLIVGGLVLLVGQVIPGAILLVMGGLYHISQLKPVYMVNRMLFPGQYRPPFIVRRLDQMDRELSGVTIFSSSWSGLFFNKFLFNLVFGALRYGIVIMILPYEITKGFLVNHGLKDQLRAKMRA